MPLSPETVAAVCNVLLQAIQAEVGMSGDAGREVEHTVEEMEKAVLWLATEEAMGEMKVHARAALAGGEAEEDLAPVQRSLTVTSTVELMYKQTSGNEKKPLGERFNNIFMVGERKEYEDGCFWMALLMWPMLAGIVVVPLLGIPPLVDWSSAGIPGLHWLLVAGSEACGLSLLNAFGRVCELVDVHVHSIAVRSLDGVAYALDKENRAAMAKAAQKRPGLPTPRTSVLLLLFRVVLTGAAVAVEVFDIATNDDFTFGPLGDAISGVYMLGEALLAGFVAANSPLSWEFADPQYGRPLTETLTGLCPYVLPAGVTWSDHPFAGQLLLSPLSVLLAPLCAALQWLVANGFTVLLVGLEMLFSTTRDASWKVRWLANLGIVFPAIVLLFCSALGFLAGVFACAGAVFPVLLVFVGPSMVSCGSFAQGIASTSLCFNILITHVSGHGVAVMLIGLDASKTAQLAVLYTILAGWCAYLLLQQTSHGLSTPASLQARFGQVPDAGTCFMWLVLCFEWLLLLGGLPTLLASSIVWLPDDGWGVRTVLRTIGIDLAADTSEAGDASSSRVELQQAAGAAGDDRV